MNKTKLYKYGFWFFAGLYLVNNAMGKDIIKKLDENLRHRQEVIGTLQGVVATQRDTIEEQDRQILSNEQYIMNLEREVDKP